MSPSSGKLSELLMSCILILLSETLTSNKVPPLKSTPKFKPLKNRKRILIKIAKIEKILAIIKNLEKLILLFIII